MNNILEKIKVRQDTDEEDLKKELKDLNMNESSLMKDNSSIKYEYEAELENVKFYFFNFLIVFGKNIKF